MVSNSVVEENNGNVATVNNGNQFYFGDKRAKISPSYIGEFVKEFSKKYDKMDCPSKNEKIPFDIEEKIIYNNLFRYKEIVDDILPFQDLCDTVLNKLDNTSKKVQYKQKCLNAINNLYKNVRSNLLREKKITNDLKILQYGDDILDLMLIEMIKITANNSKLKKLRIEDRDYHIKIFMIYCFLECKILEKPKK